MITLLSLCFVITVVAVCSFLDDAVSAEPVSVGSSCSGGVALLPCGGRLMQQGTALRETLNLNLTWRRNGEELTPDSYSDLELVSPPCFEGFFEN